MIQAIKDAVLANFAPLMVPCGLLADLQFVTDSEIDAQPSGNAPLVQIKFSSEDMPMGLAGIGSATCFTQVTNLLVFLRTTAPEPQASRELYRLWYQRCGGNLVGVKIALQQLVATGLAVGSDSFGVQLGIMTPANVRGTNYTAALQCPLRFARMYDG